MKNMEISDIFVNPVIVYFNIALCAYVVPKRQIQSNVALGGRQTENTSLPGSSEKGPILPGSYLKSGGDQEEPPEDRTFQKWPPRSLLCLTVIPFLS